MSRELLHIARAAACLNDSFAKSLDENALKFDPDQSYRNEVKTRLSQQGLEHNLRLQQKLAAKLVGGRNG